MFSWALYAASGQDAIPWPRWSADCPARDSAPIWAAVFLLLFAFWTALFSCCWGTLIVTVTQVFFGRLLSPATGSQNHGSTLKWQAAASQSHLRTRCKLLGRSGDHWHLIILCKPLLRQYQLCKGEAGICPSSSTSSPGMANAASATWLISWAKSKYSKFQNPTGMVSRCLS